MVDRECHYKGGDIYNESFSSTLSFKYSLDFESSRSFYVDCMFLRSFSHLYLNTSQLIFYSQLLPVSIYLLLKIYLPKYKFSLSVSYINCVGAKLTTTLLIKIPVGIITIIIFCIFFFYSLRFSSPKAILKIELLFFFVPHSSEENEFEKTKKKPPPPHFSPSIRLLRQIFKFSQTGKRKKRKDEQ